MRHAASAGPADVDDVARVSTPSRAATIALTCGILVLLPVLIGGVYLWARHQYQNPYPEVDGVLWRQVASVEDPLDASLYRTDAPSIPAYVDALNGVRWDGTPDGADAIDLSHPTLVVHDVEETPETVSFRVFISSGTRVAPSGEGFRWPGEPEAFFTCYDVEVSFPSSGAPSVGRDRNVPCPAPLTDRMPSGAVYMKPSTFDG